MDNLIEAAGYLALVAFAWFVWPPLALLVGGVLLVAAGNIRAARRRRAAAETPGKPAPSTLDRVIRAAAAFRAAPR